LGFELNHVEDLRAAPVVDREGAKIGTVEDIFIDRQTGRPAWAAVSTGLLGRRHTLVPLFDGFLNTNGEVQLPLAKAQVKDAPSINPGEELTPALERRMWKHYGLDSYDEWQGEDRSHGLGLPDDAEDAVAREVAPRLLRLRRVVLVVVPAAPDETRARADE
jgi:sporulation protein YlmC with PRC-barrel domain